MCSSRSSDSRSHSVSAWGSEERSSYYLSNIGELDITSNAARDSARKPAGQERNVQWQCRQSTSVDVREMFRLTDAIISGTVLSSLRNLNPICCKVEGFSDVAPLHQLELPRTMQKGWWTYSWIGHDDDDLPKSKTRQHKDKESVYELFQKWKNLFRHGKVFFRIKN